MQLVPQSYGIAMSQCVYGGPRGVWLECTACDRSDRIAGAPVSISDADAAKIFRAGGWTGSGKRMLKARCPECSAVQRKRMESGRGA
jgi:hypothetical protein